MSNKQNWGYDDTKKMLNKLRTLNESKSNTSSILKEDIQQTEPTPEIILEGPIEETNQTLDSRGLGDAIKSGEVAVQ